MNNPYQFSFGRELKADPSYFKNHFRQKFKDIEATLGSRDRPNIIWMNEFADDTKLRLQDYSLNNGIPTLAATLNDFESGLAIIGGQPNAGKAQPLFTKVLTPNGWCEMGDLKVGDEVISIDGKPTKVLGVYPQGKKSVYKITLSDGTSTRACREHLWFTRTKQDREAGRLGSVKSTQEVYNTLTVRDGSVKGRNNHMLPRLDPVEFSRSPELPIHPYLVGVLLGDGCLRETTASFASADEELVALVTEAVSASGLQISKAGQYGYRIVGQKKGQPQPLKEHLQELGMYGSLAKEKRVPGLYLYSSLADRLAVLRGLLDTDGTIDKQGRITFTSTSELLAKDVCFLVRSLGGVARITGPHNTGYKKEEQFISCSASFDVAISMPDHSIPFLLTRKLDRVKLKMDNPKAMKSLNRSISRIEYDGEEECQCIFIEHSSHLYITNDFIPTHNTTAVISMIAGALDLNPDLIIVDFSFDDDAKKRQVQLMANLSGLHYSQLYTKSDLSEKEESAKILAAKKIMGWIEDGKYWPFEASEMFNLKNKNITTTLRTVGVLKDTMGVLREQYPDKKIAFFVDAWNDLDLSEESEYIGRVDNVISDLKDRANSEQIMTFFTAHIRKTEGKSYRVRLEDIKGTKAFEYAVKWGCIVRNEHRENALQNPLRLEKNGRIHPVLIMETQKQKSSDWDMPLLYPMEPSKCRLMAPTPEEYEELLMQYQSVRK